MAFSKRIALGLQAKPSGDAIGGFLGGRFPSGSW